MKNKAGILYEENEYWLICNFVERLMVDCDGWRCRRSTPRDDGTNGAHNMQGSTDKWSCSGKWVAFLLHYLCCMAYDFSNIFQMKSFPVWKHQGSILTDDTPDGALHAGIHWWTTHQTNHTKDWDPVTDDAANRAHRVLGSFPRVSNN